MTTLQLDPTASLSALDALVPRPAPASGSGPSFDSHLQTASQSLSQNSAPSRDQSAGSSAATQHTRHARSSSQADSNRSARDSAATDNSQPAANGQKADNTRGKNNADKTAADDAKPASSNDHPDPSTQSDDKTANPATAVDGSHANSTDPAPPQPLNVQAPVAKDGSDAAKSADAATQQPPADGSKTATPSDKAAQLAANAQAQSGAVSTAPTDTTTKAPNADATAPPAVQAAPIVAPKIKGDAKSSAAAGHATHADSSATNNTAATQVAASGAVPTPLQPAGPTGKSGKNSAAVDSNSQPGPSIQSQALHAADADPAHDAASPSDPAQAAVLPPPVAALAATASGTTKPADEAKAASSDPAIGSATAPAAENSVTQPPSSASASPVGQTTAASGTTGDSAGAGKTSETSPAGDVNRARFVQRVARAFQSVGTQGGSVRLRLSPAELGSVQLNLTVRDGVMNAQLQAETTQARDMLLNNLPELKQRLAEHNIQVDRFEVELFDGSTGGSSDQPRGNSDPQQTYAPAGARNTLKSTTTGTSGETAAPTIRTRPTDGGLNVLI